MVFTVAILAQGTSWAVAATQAFFHHSSRSPLANILNAFIHLAIGKIWFATSRHSYTSACARLLIAFSWLHLRCWGLAPVALRGHGGEVLVNTLCPASHVDGLPRPNK